jgi:hypothetical protein
MCVVNGRRLMIMDVLVMPGASGTVVYDYGILHPAEPRVLHCPGGRTDDAGHAEDVITAHLASAPAGTRAAILVRAMAGDGMTGAAHLYAVAERGQDSITWPVYQGIRAVPRGGVASDARSAEAPPPARAGRPPDPGSTTIARTA